MTSVLRSESDAWLERVEAVQPVLWAVMVSLAELWRAHGVRPAAVVGHSQGEIAAACVAGALTLADGAKVVALRSRAVLALAGRGGMASVGVSAEQAAGLTAPHGERISVAAVNGPHSVTLSGDPDALDALLADCERDGIWARRVPVDYASHSPQVEELRERLLTDLADLTPKAADIPFYSTVTGGPLDDTTGLDAAYWYTNLRGTVLLDDTVRALLDAGHDAFIETSAHPVLTTGILETVESTGARAAVLSTLRRGEGGPDRFTTALAQAYVHGVDVDWDRTLPGGGPRPAGLPTYAFQRERDRLTGATGGTADARGLGLVPCAHPVLGAAVALADSDGVVLTGRIGRRTHPWLAEHLAPGTALLPGAAFVDLALHAALLDRPGHRRGTDPARPPAAPRARRRPGPGDGGGRPRGRPPPRRRPLLPGRPRHRRPGR
ncbi:putative protein OS=Streptomyces fumanus OX=67302 GN=GCM10018772_62380 PE=4 SV=1 [Streptomyces fumanus]